MAEATNMYGQARTQIWEHLSSRLDGSPEALALVLSSKELLPAARNAVEKSLATRGYPATAIAYARIADLEAKELFALVEGLDPLCLLASDKDAAIAYEDACKRPFTTERALRVFGREARAFGDLGAMLEDEDGKQRVWRLLKTLPHA